MARDLDSHELLSLHGREGVPPPSPPPQQLPVVQDSRGIHRSYYSRLIQRSWVLEILAWLLAAITLTILIIVLATFDGKPLSHWHSSISVNTLVNVLTTSASIALTFPVASSIAQLRWLWLGKEETRIADIESFGAGPIDVFVMVWKHPTMCVLKRSGSSLR